MKTARDRAPIPFFYAHLRSTAPPFLGVPSTFFSRSFLMPLGTCLPGGPSTPITALTASLRSRTPTTPSLANTRGHFATLISTSIDAMRSRISNARFPPLENPPPTMPLPRLSAPLLRVPQVHLPLAKWNRSRLRRPPSPHIRTPSRTRQRRCNPRRVHSSPRPPPSTHSRPHSRPCRPVSKTPSQHYSNRSRPYKRRTMPSEHKLADQKNECAALSGVIGKPSARWFIFKRTWRSKTG